MHQRHTAAAAAGPTVAAGGTGTGISNVISSVGGVTGAATSSSTTPDMISGGTTTTPTDGMTSGGGGIVGRQKRRTVRSKKGGGGRFFKNTNVNHYINRLLDMLPSRFVQQIKTILADEDLLVTLIQATSVIILLGCACTLFWHYFGSSSSSSGDEEDDDGDDDATTTSSLTWLGWFSSLFFQSSVAHLSYRPSTMLEKKIRKANGLYPRKDYPFSPIYTIPDALTFVGDKSDRYAKLRLKYDSMDLPIIKPKYTFGTMPMNDHEKDGETFSSTLPVPYDIFNCPSKPPPDYPYSWNLLEVLHHWPPDDPTIPNDRKVYQGLCVFDYHRDYDKAMNYRNAELPFVVQNDPQVQQTVSRWNAPGYMEGLLGHEKHRAEYSESNHFMYWNRPRGMGKQQQRRQQQQQQRARAAAQRRQAKEEEEEEEEDDDERQKEKTAYVHRRRRLLGQVKRRHGGGGSSDPMDLSNWKEPTKMIRMSYEEWLSHANLTESGTVVGPDDPHWYFRLIGCGETGPEGQCDKGSSEYLFDELPFFQPRETLYIVDPLEQKVCVCCIHNMRCRVIVMCCICTVI